MFDININEKNYYLAHDFSSKQRTKKRLIQIKNIGLIDFGDGSFGIPDVVSGIYIEIIWNYNNNEWSDYFDWLKSIIKKV